MKSCIKCGESKPLSEYYRHPGMADGHLGKCKSCCKTESKANRNSKIDYYRAYDLLRAKQPDRKKNSLAQTQKWRQEDRRRSRAHNMVARAVAAGKLIPQPCEECGSNENIHAHHDDYAKPLDVKWLCPADHKKRHKEITPSTHR